MASVCIFSDVPMDQIDKVYLDTKLTRLLTMSSASSFLLLEIKHYLKLNDILEMLDVNLILF